MSSLVYYKNKKTGITYVYENSSKWNKEKQRADCQRKCIGKLDPVTNEIVPTGKRGLGRGEALFANALVIGNFLLCEKIVDNFGLKTALKNSFPGAWDKILTCAYYLVSEGGSLCHCESWSARHETPYKGVLHTQRISELLRELALTNHLTFFKEWIRARAETEYFAMDVTSVSSYSEQNEYVRYGYNRDHEDLPQINMCMLLGENSGVPVYYETLPGSIKDVNMLRKVVALIKWLDAWKLHFVMDRGFYSETNIDALYNARYRFTIGVPFTVGWAKELVNSSREDIETYENYRRVGEQDYFVSTDLYDWKGHRCYRHVYYDSMKATEDYAILMRKIRGWERELSEDKPIKEHQKYYERYFTVKETPKRGKKIIVNDKAIQDYKKKETGFFVLISNDIKEAEQALRTYRDKDHVEKGFDDLKNALDCKRLRVHSAETMKGRMFIQFIALIVMAGIRKIMRDSGLDKQYTMPEVLDEMKSLQKIMVGGHKKPIYTRRTKLQAEILDAFGLRSNSYV
jgi:transposase